MAVRQIKRIGNQEGFTLVELLVVLVIMALTMRFVLPGLFFSTASSTLPEVQWMEVLGSAQEDLKKSGAWLELLPVKPIQGRVWRWNSATSTWQQSAWQLPKTLTEEALAFQLKTPFPQQHFWMAPVVGVIPFVQALCLSGHCVALTPSGEVMPASDSDIVNRVTE
jgi:prepilin-type N-terminal cleavage/methylation domain-containing protein